MIDHDAIDRLFDWMCAGAQPPQDMTANVDRLIHGLRAAGVPISRFAVFILTIHPTVAGKRIAWRPEEGVTVLNADHAFFKGPYFLNSPIREVYLTKATMRRCFARGDEPDFDDLTELRDQGVTDYYAQPLVHVGGESDGMSWTTDRPEGFTDEMIAALDKLNPAISRLIETYILKINTTALLSTYVGRNAGPQVQNGQIQRGDVERIPSVILFADLIGFTLLSNTRPIEEVMAALNAYFGAMEAAIQRRGGEILKFIGDGVLAIFPTGDDPQDTAQQAMQAVDDARGATSAGPGFRAALHVGEAIYGNIGGETRLDFTAIGPDVNLTARLLDKAGGIDAALVCSGDFAALTHGRAVAAGAVELKGFAAPAPLYRL